MVSGQRWGVGCGVNPCDAICAVLEHHPQRGVWVTWRFCRGVPHVGHVFLQIRQYHFGEKSGRKKVWGCRKAEEGIRRRRRRRRPTAFWLRPRRRPNRGSCKRRGRPSDGTRDGQRQRTGQLQPELAATSVFSVVINVPGRWCGKRGAYCMGCVHRIMRLTWWAASLDWRALIRALHRPTWRRERRGFIHLHCLSK